MIENRLFQKLIFWCLLNVNNCLTHPNHDSVVKGLLSNNERSVTVTSSVEMADLRDGSRQLLLIEADQPHVSLKTYAKLLRREAFHALGAINSNSTRQIVFIAKLFGMVRTHNFLVVGSNKPDETLAKKANRQIVWVKTKQVT